MQEKCNADACLHCQVARVDFAPQHALSYNELIGLVKFNILTSDWGDEDHAESILSEKRSQWSSQMFKNIRCAVSRCSCPWEERTDALSVHGRAHGKKRQRVIKCYTVRHTASKAASLTVSLKGAVLLDSQPCEGHLCRLSCCVAGVCNIAVKELDVKETLEFLADRHLHATGSL